MSSQHPPKGLAAGLAAIARDIHQDAWAAYVAAFWGSGQPTQSYLTGPAASAPEQDLDARLDAFREQMLGQGQERTR